MRGTSRKISIHARLHYERQDRLRREQWFGEIVWMKRAKRGRMRKTPLAAQRLETPGRKRRGAIGRWFRASAVHGSHRRSVAAASIAAAVGGRTVLGGIGIAAATTAGATGRAAE